MSQENLEQAENRVGRDLTRLETAMEQLEGKVKHGRERVDRAVAAAKVPFQVAGTYAAKCRSGCLTAAQEIERNPKPYLAGTLALLGVALLLSLRRGKRLSSYPEGVHSVS
jgi:predicted secreted protein